VPPFGGAATGFARGRAGGAAMNNCPSGPRTTLMGSAASFFSSFLGFASFMQPCLVGKKFMTRCAPPDSPLDLRIGDEIVLPHDRYLR
jgi:hypothetical protein